MQQFKPATIFRWFSSTMHHSVSISKQTSKQNALTRSPAVARIAGHTGCQWPWRLSKVNDFQVIWKPICYFLQ